MNNALILLRQCIVMCLYMGIGCSLWKGKLVSKEGSKSMAHLLLYIVLPSVIIKSFCVERTPEKIKLLVISFAAAAILLAAALILSHVLLGRNSMEDFGAAFSNAGFIGFPLITAVLGSSAVFYAAGFVGLLNFLQWTYGQNLLKKEKEKNSIAGILKNPLLIGLCIGLVIFFTGIPVPEVLMTTISGVAAMNAPIAMIILGVYMGQTDFKTIFIGKGLYITCFVRLILIPAVSVAIMKLLFRGYPEMQTVLILAASAPIGSNIAVYAQKLNLDYTYAVRLVCLSTVLSVITMPVLMLFI